LEELAGAEDLCRPVRERFNRMALDLLPDLQARVAASSDPLGAALRLAIVGNMIDFGVKGTITEEEVREAIGRAFEAAFSGDVEEFRRSVHEARRILYLADNAGEIVLDRLLIEQLPKGRVVLAVRGRPVINDATTMDAQSVELTGLVEVIDNGSDVPGTVLGECSPAFQQRFREADLVIAKGSQTVHFANDRRNSTLKLPDYPSETQPLTACPRRSECGEWGSRQFWHES
jgi:uncharacterized protein with ATP-grasp and redox domains